VLLLELVNRGATNQSAEIPTWLVQGLAEQVLVANENEILLLPPRLNANGITVTSMLVHSQRQNPLEQAHRLLRTRQPLAFEQLSWPPPGQLTGEAGELYRSSAQLFVAELLQFKDGPACLRAMLAELPQHLNWQLAFLHAFQPHFARLLEVEQWWSLQCAYFTGHELTQTLPADESWRKLEEVIRSPVEVRAAPDELPLHTEVALQSIIRQWEPARQTVALQGTMRELEALRLRMAAPVVPLLDDYHRVLENYLQNRDRNGLLLLFRKQALQRHNREETLRRLDELDTQRLALRPQSAPPAPIQVETNVTTSP
jgi:hypothetical protein